MDEQIYAAAAHDVAAIIQATITALEQLAEAMRAALAPMALQRHLPAALPHTRYAMRARKMQRYARHACITK